MTSFGIVAADTLDMSTSLMYPENVVLTHRMRSSFCSVKHSGPFSAMKTMKNEKQIVTSL